MSTRNIKLPSVVVPQDYISVTDGSYKKAVGMPLMTTLGIETERSMQKLSRADAAKAKRANAVSETFQYGEKNWRDPDWMFATVTHAQAMEWLTTLEAAPPDIIGEWGTTFAENCREWVDDAEAMGQSESIFTGKQLVMMHVLMEKVTKRATQSILATLQDIDET